MPLVLDPAAQDLLFREARTANTFTDEPVSEEQVQAIYDLVKYGPTAFNQSPLRIVLVRSDDARARLVSHMAEGNQPKTSTAPLVAILAADNEFHEELPALFPHFPQAKDAFFSERPVRESAAALNAALQAAYFIIGVRAAGLAMRPDDRLRRRGHREGVPRRRPQRADGRQHRQAGRRRLVPAFAASRLRRGHPDRLIHPVAQRRAPEHQVLRGPSPYAVRLAQDVMPYAWLRTS